MRQEDVYDQIRPIIVEACIDASPDNYELCHRVITRSDPKARACFERLSAAGRFDAEAFGRLRDEAGPPRGHIDHRSLIVQVDRQLGHILSLAQGAQTDATLYSQSLDAAANDLKAQSSSEAALPIVDQLVAKTVTMAERAFALETRLQKASEELDGLKADLARARTEGATDALTSLPNRRAFDERLAEAILVANGTRRPLSLAFCDIDHFKMFNDTWGHKLGDQVLRLVGGQLARTFSEDGFPARLGGEEFVVLLPGFGSADALEAMRDFCALIAARTIRSRTDGRDVGRITISIGVTTLRRGERAEAFVERADAIMYQAKQQGRNRVLSGV